MELTKKRLQLFENITQAIAIPGNEAELSKILEKYYLELGCEIVRDNLGSIYAHKKSKNKNALKVMVAAHLDEVGFVVREITSTGAIKVHPLGGSWEQTLLSSRVVLVNKYGERFFGAVGSIPPHLLQESDKAKPMQIKNMFFDFGFTSAEEVKEKHIAIGDAIIVEGSLKVLGNGKRVLAKAFDNRYGCVLGVELLELIKEENLDIDLYIGANVQEEVGLRGAQTAANLIKPDLAIILDCSPANDISGNKQELGQLGEGILIRIADSNMIAFPALIDYQIAKCKEENVKYQYYTSPGGTDAGIIHKSLDGILTFTNCICARNIHTCSSIIDLDDYEAAKKVILNILRTIDKNKIKEFREAQR